MRRVMVELELHIRNTQLSASASHSILSSREEGTVEDIRVEGNENVRYRSSSLNCLDVTVVAIRMWAGPGSLNAMADRCTANNSVGFVPDKSGGSVPQPDCQDRR